MKHIIHLIELVLSILIVLTANLFIPLDKVSLVLVIIIYLLMPSSETVIKWRKR